MKLALDKDIRTLNAIASDDRSDLYVGQLIQVARRLVDRALRYEVALEAIGNLRSGDHLIDDAKEIARLALVSPK